MHINLIDIKDNTVAWKYRNTGYADSIFIYL